MDYAAVTTTLILRLIDVQVAISQGTSANEVAVQNLDPAASFKAKSVDRWINGMWFTSLALSLTTTLVAVLTKQWINEYMILPSGTPKDRSRIRHFRFVGLEQWHVPLIIGLLPVLMHISLGVFFAGFTIFLCSLDVAMAASLGCLTGVGALAYLVSNLLPLLYANCPYKTPLALYTFRLVSWVRRCFASLRLHRASPTSRSLKDVERVAITREADNLDALSLSWLHNTSSNASVHSIVVQSLGSLPLQSIGVMTSPKGITAPVSDPSVWLCRDFVAEKDEDRPAVVRAIRAHHRYDQPVERLERLQRGALRFGKFDMLDAHPSKYGTINKSLDLVIKAVSDDLLAEGNFTRPDGGVDVLFWGKLFEVALQSGLDFLEIDSSHGDDPPSSIWCQLLKGAVIEHDCSSFNCDGDKKDLFSYSLGPEKFPLVVNVYNVEQNATSNTLSDALVSNMQPSFIRWLLHVGFPHALEPEKRRILGFSQHLPDDILLVLTLLQTRSIQATSSALETTTQKTMLSSDTSVIQGYPEPPQSLFHRVLMVAEAYALNLGPWSAHQDVDRATLSALKTVTKSDVFESSTVMTLADKGFVVEILFAGLNRRFQIAAASGDRDASWLTPTLFKKIWHVATSALESGAVDNGWELLAHIFTYVSCFATHSFATETIYAYLVREDWLRDIGARFSRLSHSATSEAETLPARWRPGYVYVAVTYLNGLSSSDATSKALSAAREYIEAPAHLSTLSKILLFGDSDTQNMLWNLAETISSDTCSACIADLARLVACVGMADEYDEAKVTVHVDVHSYRRVHYRPFQDLPSLITTFARDLKRNHTVPPVYTKPKEDLSQVRTCLHLEK